MKFLPMTYRLGGVTAGRGTKVHPYFLNCFFFSIFYTYENYFEKLNLKIHSMLTLYSGMTLSL